MKSTYNLSLFLGISMLCNFSYSQEIVRIHDTIAHEKYTEEVTPKNEFDFFASEEPLQMTLCFDIREFLKTKDHPVYYDATLTLRIDENDSISQHIKVKARGIMRRLYCSFPPIMLKFKDTDSETERIQGKGTVKLVTQCNRSSMFESYVFKEYLAYKMYSLVTPYSFKTRLVKINYVDINKPNKAYSAYGFLIENEDNMAIRNNAVITDNMNAMQKNMNSEDMARVAFYNYMIGNTDWSVANQHNVKILRSLEVPSDKGIPVAYDFDYSGFVNTVYSVPTEGLPIKDVTERYYAGLCYSNEELVPIIDEFAGMKEKFLKTINDFEYLSMRDKKITETYINSFYKMYKAQNFLLNDLKCTCKQF
jgi:hypothetical protein